MNYSRFNSSPLKYYNNSFYYCWLFRPSIRLLIVFCLRDSFYRFSYINYGKDFLIFVFLDYSNLIIYSLITFFFYSTVIVSFSWSLKLNYLFNYSYFCFYILKTYYKLLLLPYSISLIFFYNLVFYYYILAHSFWLKGVL
jgi:hypothetical protein